MSILPTLPPERSLKALEQQLNDLQKIKGRNCAEAEGEKSAWEHQTQSIIEAAYGKISSEFERFFQAKNTGTYNLMGIKPPIQQSNFDLQIRELESLLKALINMLRLHLPEEEIKGAYDAGDEYSFYRDLSGLIAAATRRIFFIDAFLDEQLFNLYVSKAPTTVSVRILSKNIGLNVEVVGNKFASSRPLELRSSTRVHDRVIFIDQRGWIIGQSIKDAAKNKPTYLVELNEPILTATENAHTQIWEQATSVI